jgi:hypothetical protein
MDPSTSMPIMNIFTLLFPNDRPFHRILVMRSFLLQYWRENMKRKVRKIAREKVIPLMATSKNMKHR